MNKKKRYISIVVVLLLLTMSMSCANTESVKEEKKSEKEKAKIGITFDTFVLDRWIRDRDVFLSTAQKLGAKVDVQNANGDEDKQREQIKKFIEEKMDAIVIVAVNCYQLSDVVREARNAGIVVVSYDRLIQSAKTDLYLTVDNEIVGQKMAEMIMDKLPDGGNIVMICGPEMDTNSIDVASGFERKITDDKWKIIYKNNVKAWTPENGFLAVTEAFESVGNTKIDAVMCGNDGLAGYAIRALSEMQKAGEVIVVGQDADLEACQRVVEGTQSMTVYKPIEELAKVAAECTIKLINKEDIGTIGDISQMKTIENGAAVEYRGLLPIAVTKESMDEIIIDSGFHLREEVYLNVEAQ
ncbi:D-xylose transport system substrate-binding protein [Aequitasia blattaphilus]|uniref:Substrate-binding domain-containing protein n=1 Tax=Aequitasia blattaphilus TaxID=2949332 RepID=A0ABT1EAL3_9FIRM|nr:substrate-binding domain-containing protein [Aequitasia blattaphilus]MCP1102843.1 substrate-binding domain-containing protein [Aequitasia blattaphilus]MCR8615483.1 substrate-binding domain-containing protein [Aequitasia blattaphilus]